MHDECWAGVVEESGETRHKVLVVSSGRCGAQQPLLDKQAGGLILSTWFCSSQRACSMVTAAVTCLTTRL